MSFRSLQVSVLARSAPSPESLFPFCVLGTFMDLYRFSINERRWDLLNTSGTGPGGRFAAGAACTGGQLYIFGGVNKGCLKILGSMGYLTFCLNRAEIALVTVLCFLRVYSLISEF